VFIYAASNNSVKPEIVKLMAKHAPQHTQQAFKYYLTQGRPLDNDKLAIEVIEAFLEVGMTLADSSYNKVLAATSYGLRSVSKAISDCLLSHGARRGASLDEL